MENWSVQEVCSFIEQKGFEDDVIELFRVNRIRGPALSLLTEEDLKELGVAALGDRKILLKLFQPTTITGHGKNKVYIHNYICIKIFWQAKYHVGLSTKCFKGRQAPLIASYSQADPETDP